MTAKRLHRLFSSKNKEAREGIWNLPKTLPPNGRGVRKVELLKEHQFRRKNTNDRDYCTSTKMWFLKGNELGKSVRKKGTNSLLRQVHPGQQHILYLQKRQPNSRIVLHQTCKL
jgi:hypothetical protein